MKQNSTIIFEKVELSLHICYFQPIMQFNGFINFISEKLPDVT
jgi:hypothetical protein